MGHTHLFVCSKSKRELPRAFVDDSNHALSCHRTLVSLVTQGPVVSLDVFPRRRGAQSCRCMSSVTNKASSSVHVKSHDRYNAHHAPLLVEYAAKRRRPAPRLPTTQRVELWTTLPPILSASLPSRNQATRIWFAPAPSVFRSSDQTRPTAYCEILSPRGSAFAFSLTLQSREFTPGRRRPNEGR